MKIIKFFLSLIMFFLINYFSFAYQDIILDIIDAHPVRVIKVVLDGNHYIITSLTTTGGDSLVNLTKKVHGISSVNGVFFCPSDYPECNGLTYSKFERIFAGEAKQYSKYRDDTGVRGIFGFLKNGEPIFVQKNYGYIKGLAINKNWQKINKIYFGLGNFPILLINGINVTHAYDEFLDNKIKNEANKNFICYNKLKNTIYMGTVGDISIYKLADFLKKNFNCYDALFLDGGASAGMIYNGLIFKKPHRKIMDAFVVVTSGTYKKLFGYYPSRKINFIPPPKVKLNKKYYKLYQILKIKLNEYLNKYPQKRRQLIYLLRRLYTNEEDSQKREILKRLLIQIYTIGTINY